MSRQNNNAAEQGIYSYRRCRPLGPLRSTSGGRVCVCVCVPQGYKKLKAWTTTHTQTESQKHKSGYPQPPAGELTSTSYVVNPDKLTLLITRFNVY